MYERFTGPDKKIVVGVAFDEGMQELLEPSTALAKRSAMTLRLVHVCEPWQGGAVTAAYPGEYMANIISQRAISRHMEEAEQELKRIKERLEKDKDIKVETHVLYGEPSHGIHSDAVSNKASLIICGAKDSSHRFIPKGLSTPLGLMADSTIPVLVVPESVSSSDLGQKQLKLLVADDLGDASRAAISVGFELAVDLKNVDFMHLHVVSQTKEEMNDWANMVMEVAMNNDLDDLNLSQEKILEDANKEINRRMNARLGFSKNLLETDGVYHRIIRYGEIDEELKNVVEQERPDIILFGRHEIWHRRPFSIGKVPFFATLNLKTPVLIAPKAR